MQNEIAIVASAPLSASEVRELEKLEAVIESGFQTFQSVGRALQTIRDKRLWRDRFKSFEDYCKVKHDMALRTAYEQIEAAEVVDSLRNFAKLPRNPYQARQLAKLQVDVRRAVWGKIVKTAPKSGITAEHIATVVEQETGRPAGASPGEISAKLAAGFGMLTEEEQLEFNEKLREERLAARGEPEVVLEEEDEEIEESPESLLLDAFAKAKASMRELSDAATIIDDSSLSEAVLSTAKVLAKVWKERKATLEGN